MPNTLTWTANTEPDLKDYRVWRSIGGGAEVVIATVMKGTQTYVDTDTTVDGVYSYSLTARDSGNLESLHSVSVTKTVNTVPPSAPVGLSVV